MDQSGAADAASTTTTTTTPSLPAPAPAAAAAAATSADAVDLLSVPAHSKMTSTYRQERTCNNHRFDMIKSGLQKYIRRGMTDKALYCAGELDLMKLAPPRGRGLRTNFLHRLMVIFLEDVGVGGLGFWATLNASLVPLTERHKKDKSEPNLHSASAMAERRRLVAEDERMLHAIVTTMCALPKARICSHVRAISCNDQHTQTLMEQPKYAEIKALAAKYEAAWAARPTSGTGLLAYVQQQFESAVRSRSWTAVWWGRKLFEDESIPLPAKTNQATAIFVSLLRALPPHLKNLVHVAERWYKELKTLKEAFLTWMLLVVAAVVDAKCEPVKLVMKAGGGGGAWIRNRKEDDGGLAEDEFIADRHTAQGRGKSIVEFATVGAHVENESPVVVALFKDFYIDQKVAWDAVQAASGGRRGGKRSGGKSDKVSKRKVAKGGDDDEEEDEEEGEEGGVVAGAEDEDDRMSVKSGVDGGAAAAAATIGAHHGGVGGSPSPSAKRSPAIARLRKSVTPGGSAIDGKGTGNGSPASPGSPTSAKRALAVADEEHATDSDDVISIPSSEGSFWGPPTSAPASAPNSSSHAHKKSRLGGPGEGPSPAKESAMDVESSPVSANVGDEGAASASAAAPDGSAAATKADTVAEVDALLHQIAARANADGGMKETEIGELLFRIQLTTSASHVDVYFVEHRESKHVLVVKGPLPLDMAQNAVSFGEWKKSAGLPIVPTVLAMLIPDRWPEGVPLGRRNTTPRDKPAAFLISMSLRGKSQLKTRTHSSKLWPPTTVMEPAGSTLHLNIDRITDVQMRDYVAALLARWLYGISDLADRNFLLRADGRVVMVDEEYRGRPVNFMVELKKNKCAVIEKWVAVQKNYDALGLTGWVVPVEVAGRYALLSSKENVLRLFRGQDPKKE